MDDQIAIATGVALILFSMFFGTAHLAVRTFSRVRLAQLLEARGRDRWMERLLAHRTAITLSTASLRMAATLGLILVVVHLLRPESQLAWGPVRFAAMFAFSAVVVLICGVAIPHAWARYAGESLLARTLPLLDGLRVVLGPVVWALYLFDELVRRLVGAPRLDASSESDRIEQELLDAVSEGEKQGAFDQEEKEMIEAVIELRDTYAGEIMTPRTEIIGIRAEASLAEVKKVIVREGHSRLPVYQGTIDVVLGVLYAKDLLKVEADDATEAQTLMRHVPFVPETKLLRDLLREFQAKKVQMAIVLDEYGGTAGLVTIEDILEELVGEIVDEYEPPEPEPFVEIDADTVEIDARVHIDELNDRLDVALPEDADYDTVGGFVFSTLGRIPAVGERLEHGNLHIEVLEAEERRINRLRVHVLRNGENGRPEA